MFGLYDTMQKWLDYCPRGYIEGGYQLFTWIYYSQRFITSAFTNYVDKNQVGNWYWKQYEFLNFCSSDFIGLQQNVEKGVNGRTVLVPKEFILQNAKENGNPEKSISETEM